jgi:hypothetical protein
MTTINNFWILSTSGIPLFLLEEYEHNDILIGGFFSALQILIDSVEESPFNKIELKNKTFFYYFKEPIISVLEAEATTEIETQVYQIITQRLAKTFLDLYPKEQILNSDKSVSYYQTFKTYYYSITSEINEMLKKSHKDFLAEYFVEAATNENILGMIIYDLKQDEILSKDIPQECKAIDFESFGSMLFAFLSRLGKQLKTGIINEVLVRGENYWLGGFRKGSLAVFMLFDLDYFGKVLPDFVNAPLLMKEKQNDDESCF